jgi:hypothetical protein
MGLPVRRGEGYDYWSLPVCWDSDSAGSLAQSLSLSILWLTTKLILVFASTVTLGSESQDTHDHILQSDCSGSLRGPLPHWLTAKLLLALHSTVILGSESCGTHGQSSSLNCCRPSPAQSFLSSGPVRIHVIIYVRSKIFFMLGSSVSSSTRRGVSFWVGIIFLAP